MPLFILAELLLAPILGWVGVRLILHARRAAGNGGPDAE